MDNLITEINKGKIRGYRSEETIDGVRYFIEYAIRKKADKYIAYHFTIDASKMANVEDYGNEEFGEFHTVSDAIAFIEQRKGELGLFQHFIGISPI